MEGFVSFSVAFPLGSSDTWKSKRSLEDIEINHERTF
jgi:hypothetical protein